METLLIILLIGTALFISSQPTIPVEEPQEQTVEVSQKDRVMLFDSYDVMTIDAEDWLCKYANKVYDGKAQRKMQDSWKGKFIKLTGKVHKAYNNIDGCYITIIQEKKDSITDGWCVIYLYFFDEGEKEKAMNCRPGDQITVIGYGKYIIGPEMIDCHFR